MAKHHVVYSLLHLPRMEAVTGRIAVGACMIK
jgi:hypothetical protein